MSTIAEFPIANDELKKIADEACSSALGSTTIYKHSLAADWNTQIINQILQALISRTSQTFAASATDASPAPYKFHVNSVIIEHTPPEVKDTIVSSDPKLDESSTAAQVGGNGESIGSNPLPSMPASQARQGMHSASGAYWNGARDGMASFKHAGDQMRGFDVIISMVWISN